MGDMLFNRLTAALQVAMIVLTWAKAATDKESELGKEISKSEIKALILQVLDVFGKTLDDIL